MHTGKQFAGVFLAGVMLAAAGCASVGKDFATHKVEEIEVG